MICEVNLEVKGMFGNRAILTILVFLGISLQASANISDDSVSFGDWVSNDTVDVTPSFTVSIDGNGDFEIDVWIDDDSIHTGDITGIAFDIGVSNFNADDSIDDQSHNYTEFANNVTKLGNANFAGATKDPFDVILQYDPSNKVDSALHFKVLNSWNLTLKDWTRVGVRWQATTAYEESGREGSDKVIAIPEPGSMALVSLGLLALFFSRVKRSKV